MNDGFYPQFWQYPYLGEPPPENSSSSARQSYLSPYLPIPLRNNIFREQQSPRDDQGRFGTLQTNTYGHSYLQGVPYIAPAVFEPPPFPGRRPALSPVSHSPSGNVGLSHKIQPPGRRHPVSQNFYTNHALSPGFAASTPGLSPSPIATSWNLAHAVPQSQALYDGSVHRHALPKPSYEVSGVSLSQPSTTRTPASGRRRSSGVERLERRSSACSPPSPLPTPEKRFKCHMCDHCFLRRRDRDRHERSVHTRELLYHCGSCGLGFVRTDARARHWRNHPECTAVHDRASGTR